MSYKCKCGGTSFEPTTFYVKGRPIWGVKCKNCGEVGERRDVLKTFPREKNPKLPIA